MSASFAFKASIGTLFAAASLMLGAISTRADPIIFSSAVATYYQGFFAPSQMIDGILSGTNGWAIAQGTGTGDQTLSESALLTIQSPLAAGPHSLTFTIYQNYGAQHLLGDFSLGYTTDASPTLTSTDNLLSITSASSLNGVTFSYPTQGQILVTNPNSAPDTDIYTIQANINSAAAVTGIFLNAINDPTNGLPTGGPGLQPVNGNFVVSEFEASSQTVAATPEPSACALLVASAVSGIALGWRRKVRKNSVQESA